MTSRVRRAPAVGALVVCLSLCAGGAEAPRWVNVAPLPEEASDALVADLANLGKATVVDAHAYNCTLVPESDPATDKGAIYARRFRAVRDRVKALSPIRQGILFQATIGHGWTPNSMTPWQKIVTDDNQWKPYKFCPLGKEFLAYIAKAAKTLADEKPDFFMVDDDTRLITGINGCYCPEHLAEFARRTGKERTREQVVADCKADPALAAAWDLLRRDSIGVLLKTIRAQFPPETPGMFCCCNFDAHHAGHLARLLAAPGQRPSVRLNNAWYTNQSMVALPRILSMTAREIADIGEGVDILDEMDTCPQNRYSTSATRMVDHVAMTAFEGCVGGKIWITRLGNVEETRSGAYYRTLLSRQKGFLEAVTTLDAARTGVVIPIPEKRPLGVWLSYTPSDWGVSFFGYMGLPYRHARAKKGDVVALSAFDLDYFSDAEMTNLLSGAVLLDGAAAIALAERGFGRLTGVEARTWKRVPISMEQFADERLVGGLDAADLTAHAAEAEELSRFYHADSGLTPADEYLAPGSLRFRNALGGTVVTVAAKLVAEPSHLTKFWYYNETRKRQVTKILRALGGGRVPGGVFYAGDEPAICLNGTLKDGHGLFVLDNIGVDTIERPEMVFEGDVPKAVERLGDDGVWQPVGFRAEKGEVRLESPVGSFRPAVFRFGTADAPVKVIFDTDMLTDFDDVGALACLHALADAGECEILATLSCTRGNASVAAVEVINGYYGRPDLPVGCAKGMGVSGGGPNCDPKQPLAEGDHGKYVKLAKDYPQWVRHPNSDDAPDANDVYRRVLAAQPDGSVVICSVGFITNLRRLLETKGDAVSPLDGRALVAKKVRKWVAMACNYPSGFEYNSRCDPTSSRIAFETWPTPVVFSDFQCGWDVYAGRAIAETEGPRNPVKDVFAGNIPSRAEVAADPHKHLQRAFGMGGRSAWDETAVLAAVRGEERYFNVHRGEYRMVGDKGEDVWVPDETNGRHVRLTEKLNKVEVGKIIDELICRRPAANGKGK